LTTENLESIALAITTTINSRKITDAFGKNSKGEIKNGSALAPFSTWHNTHTGPEIFTMKVQMRFENGKWSKIECKN
jgi:hypothetical protein